MLKSCQKCSKEFKCKPSEDRLFCSRQCWKENCEQNRTYECTFCQCKFQIKPEAKRKKGKPFCSSACFNKYQTGPNNTAWKGGEKQRNCDTCNKTFSYPPRREGTIKYCSIACRGMANRGEKCTRYSQQTVICNYCKATIKIPKNRLKERNFCNRNCADKGHSSFVRGENNGRFVHGMDATPYPSGWTTSYKNTIRERDGHTCRLCGTIQENHKGKLHVHHIDYDKNNLVINNLITLCKYCHGKMHGNLRNREEWKQALLSLLKE